MTTDTNHQPRSRAVLIAEMVVRIEDHLSDFGPASRSTLEETCCSDDDDRDIFAVAFYQLMEDLVVSLPVRTSRY